jgi:hypothetical protein
MFEHVIGRASAHRLNRRFLAHRAGYEDEGRLGSALARELQRTVAGEFRHAEIGNDDVWREFRERAAILGLGFHAQPFARKAVRAELVDNELGVELAVLDDEDADFCVCTRHAINFRGALRS